LDRLAASASFDLGTGLFIPTRATDAPPPAEASQGRSTPRKWWQFWGGRDERRSIKRLPGRQADALKKRPSTGESTSATPKDLQEAWALDAKGAELFFQGNLQEAEKLFMKALQLNPRLAETHGNMGHVLQKRGMYAQAVPWLEKALSLNPHLDGVPDALDFCRRAAREKATPPAQETIRRLKKAGIEFTRKYTEKGTGHGGLGPVELTYEKYKSPSVERAIEFLNQRGPVTQHYYYVEVKTPKGWVGRDIDGIYREWEQ
jgi:tetratricopeptide (TPR) repeat protein